jgi:hypothetical protein
VRAAKWVARWHCCRLTCPVAFVGYSPVVHGSLRVRGHQAGGRPALPLCLAWSAIVGAHMSMSGKQEPRNTKAVDPGWSGNTCESCGTGRCRAVCLCVIERRRMNRSADLPVVKCPWTSPRILCEADMEAPPATTATVYMVSGSSAEMDQPNPGHWSVKGRVRPCLSDQSCRRDSLGCKKSETIVHSPSTPLRRRRRTSSQRYWHRRPK